MRLGHTFKRINELITAKHSGFTPSNLLFVLKSLEKNVYCDKTLTFNIYKVILEKIIYFSPSQIIELLDCIDNWLIFSFLGAENMDFRKIQKGAVIDVAIDTNRYSDNTTIDVMGNSRLVEIGAFQSEIISKIIDFYTNKQKISMADIKDKNYLIIQGKCLKTMLKLDSMEKINWKDSLLLSNNTLNTLLALIHKSQDEISITNETFLTEMVNYINILIDVLSLKSIEETLNLLTFISNDFPLEETFNSELLLTNEILISMSYNLKKLYLTGDIQTLNFVVNHTLKTIKKCRSINLYFSRKNLTLISEMVSLYNELSNIVCTLISSCPFERLICLYGSILRLNFKIVHVGRYLSGISKVCSNSNDEVNNKVMEASIQFIRYFGIV